MAILNRQQLYQYATNAGFKGAARDEVVAIALAESGGDTQHINVNGASSGWGGKSVPAGTRDRGVLQINDWWNPGVSDAQAFDPAFDFSWAYKVTSGGQPGLFNAYWSTVKNGLYKKFLTPGGGAGVTATNVSSGGQASGGKSAIAQRSAASNNTGVGAGPQYFWQYPVSQAWNGTSEYGIDFATPYGTPIQSAVNGTVVQEGVGKDASGSWGEYVVVDTNVNGKHVDWYVQHLDSIASNIVLGAQVTFGELLGSSGGQTSGGNYPNTTNYSSGPHVESGFNAPWYQSTTAGNFNPASFFTGIGGGPGGSSSSGQPPTVQTPLGNVQLPNVQTPSPDFWVRAGLVTIGIILVLLGIWSFVKPGGESITVKESGEEKK